MRVARRTGNAWDAALAHGYALMPVKVWRKDVLSAEAALAEGERVSIGAGRASATSDEIPDDFSNTLEARRVHAYPRWW